MSVFRQLKCANDLGIKSMFNTTACLYCYQFKILSDDRAEVLPLHAGFTAVTSEVRVIKGVSSFFKSLALRSVYTTVSHRHLSIIFVCQANR